MNIWARLANLDRRIYYFLLILVVALPMVKPWGLPIKTGKEARSFYETIENLPAGSTIALAIEYGVLVTTELNPQVAALYKQALGRGLRIIMWSAVDPEGANVTQSLLVPITEQMGKKYGVDWVNLGFKPGGDVTTKKLVDSFWEGAGYVDISGTRLENLPIMQGFTSMAKASLLVVVTGTLPGPDKYLKMVSIPTGLQMAVGTTAGMASTENQYYRSGQYKGLLMGARGGAEYEFLTGHPGRAIVNMDSQSAAHIMVVLLIVLGNVGYFVSKKKAALAASGR